MGLKGNIKEFNIADIFQLLSLQRKSGALNIISSKGNMLFVLNEGEIVDVSPDIRSKEQMIGQMLVDGGVISDSDRERCLRDQKKHGKKIGEILIEKGLVDEDILSIYLKIQIKECFFRVLTYSNGEYTFDSYTIQSYPPLKKPVRVDQLMMEGMQYLDEYPLIMEKIPSQDILIKMGRKVSVKNLGKEKNVQILAEAMKDYMEPIKHIRRSCLTLFEGYKALAKLNELSYLSIKEKKPSVSGRDLLEEKVGLHKRVRMITIANLLLTLGFVGSILFLICDIINNSGISLIMGEIFKGF